MNSNARADIASAVFSCIAQHAIRAVRGTRGAYVIPLIISKAAARPPREPRLAAISGRIEKRIGRVDGGAGGRGGQRLGFLPTYLPVLRLSNWLGTYVAEAAKISHPGARIAAMCVEPMIIPASSGARYIVIIMKQG